MNSDTSMNGTIVLSEALFRFDELIYVNATHDTVITAGQLFLEVEDFK